MFLLLSSNQSLTVKAQYHESVGAFGKNFLKYWDFSISALVFPVNSFISSSLIYLIPRIDSSTPIADTSSNSDKLRDRQIPICQYVFYSITSLYSFLIIAHLKIDEKTDEDYPPFVLLKKTYLKYLDESNIRKNKKEQEVELMKIWASAHGLAAIACMSGVIPSFDWDEMLEGGELLRYYDS